MIILTDELITKAAVAIVDKRFDVINGRVPTEHEVAQLYARACLEAALPDVVEKCAQIAEGELTREGRYRNDVGSRQRNWVIDGSSPYGNGRLDSADAIRSLLNKEDGNG